MLVPGGVARLEVDQEILEDSDFSQCSRPRPMGLCTPQGSSLRRRHSRHRCLRHHLLSSIDALTVMPPGMLAFPEHNKYFF